MIIDINRLINYICYSPKDEDIIIAAASKTSPKLCNR